MQESSFFFGPGSRPGALDVSSGTSLAIIKPHALAERQGGAILTAMVQGGLELRALELFSVDHAAAGEFYEVYRGVVAPSEFSNMVDELTSGPCLVAEVGSRYDDSIIIRLPAFILTVCAARSHSYVPAKCSIFSL